MFEKLNNATLGVAAHGTAAFARAEKTVMGAMKKMPVALTAAIMCMLMVAPMALAADGDGGSGSGTTTTENAINKVFNKINTDMIKPLYTGILTIIGAVALIFLIKELIQGATSPAGMQRTSHITQCIVILVICVVMAFAPTIIEWVFGLGDASVKNQVGEGFKIFKSA